ncbi:MAG: hypothetical protein AAGA03_16775, partial [Planctomycetota bacterium]
GGVLTDAFVLPRSVGDAKTLWDEQQETFFGSASCAAVSLDLNQSNTRFVARVAVVPREGCDISELQRTVIDLLDHTKSEESAPESFRGIAQSLLDGNVTLRRSRPDLDVDLVMLTCSGPLPESVQELFARH